MSARRRIGLVAGLLALVGLAVGLGLALRRGPVELAPLEVELQDARRMLGPSGRAEWAERAARDAAEQVRCARAWNEALTGGAGAEERERAWQAWRKAQAAAASSVPAAREEMRLLKGDRW